MGFRDWPPLKHCHDFMVPPRQQVLLGNNLKKEALTGPTKALFLLSVQ